VTPPVRRLLALAALALVVAAACGDGTAATPSSEATDGGPTPTAPSTAPGTDAPASSEPSAVPSDAPASEAPSDAPASEEPTATPDPAAAQCTGTDANRDFFASVASAVSWSVYCPVLPAGWFVEGGQYRLAGGGWLEIAYEGPEGESLALRQGAPCETADCVPSGTDLGPADYGDLAGTLLDLGNGRYAVVVDPGANPSWTLVTDGLAEADARQIAADLAAVNPG
jgi:hypothetical protein